MSQVASRANGPTVFGMPASTGRWVFVLAGMLMNVCMGAVYAWSVFRSPVANFFTHVRLMSSVNDVSAIPTEGKYLIIVAEVNNVLHFRIFDGNGKRVADTDEQRLPEQTRQIGDLRKQLASLWPLHELTRSDKDQVIKAVTSIVRHTPVTAKQTLWPFMLFLALFTVLMPISGRIVQKVHPRTVSLVGSLIVAAGWILSSYATDVNFLNYTYGVIAGAGVGIVYGVPIAVVTRWFPDLKGLAVGLTVLGFGMSALVTAPLAQALIAASSVLQTFLILGIAFLVALVLMSLLMRFPPAGWRPEGWQGAAAAAVGERSYTPEEMLKTSSCLGLWLCFIIGSLSGLMAIGITKDVGREIIQLDEATTTGLLSFFALFNGGGRPLFGWLSDAIGHSKAAALSLLLIALASGAMVVFGGEGSVGLYLSRVLDLPQNIKALFAGEHNVILYTVCFAAFWMGLGSWLAIAPTAVATYFGPKNYATNYGIVFSAYGIGAILASLSAAYAKDIFGSYIHAFHVSGSLATVGVIIALTLMKKPKPAEATASF